jgi:hypothetical protein
MKKEIKKAQLSKRLQTKIDRINSYDKDKANNIQRLRHVANKTEVEMFGLNKALKTYLQHAKGELPQKHINLLKFNDIKEYINNSEKYKDLPLFTLNQITLICSAIIKANEKQRDN